MLSHELSYATEREQVKPAIWADPVAGKRPAVLVEIQATDPISRVGIVQQLLQTPGIQIVAEHASPSSRSAAVAVVVADVVDDLTVQMLRRLSRERAGKVVLVAGRIGEPALLDVVECGVAAVLWRRQADVDRLGRGVLTAAQGNRELPADLLNQVLAELGRVRRSGGGGPPGAPTGRLTERETGVLRLVADGLDTGEIAARMAYSERTIKSVLAGLTSRLQLRNRAHAVAYALRAGYI